MRIVNLEMDYLLSFPSGPARAALGCCLICRWHLLTISLRALDIDPVRASTCGISVAGKVDWLPKFVDVSDNELRLLDRGYVGASCRLPGRANGGATYGGLEVINNWIPRIYSRPYLAIVGTVASEECIEECCTGAWVDAKVGPLSE